MELHLIGAIILKVNRPPNEQHTADIKLLNKTKDKIENVPFMVGVGTNQVRNGFVMLDCGTEVMAYKGHGSEWLIIGEINVKNVPSGVSKNKTETEQITQALDIIADAFDESMKINQGILDNQNTIAAGLASASKGLYSTGTSVAGSPSTPLSNSAAIIRASVAVGAASTSLYRNVSKLKIETEAFTPDYSDRIRGQSVKQQDLFFDAENDCT